jgi:endonuclease IV
MWYSQNQSTCDKWRNFVRQRLTSAHERGLHVHIKEMNTHIGETELKEEEELKQCKEALKNGRNNWKSVKRNTSFNCTQ